VISRKWQNLSFYELKWAEILRDGSRHSCTCFTKISHGSKVICEQCNFAKLLYRSLFWEVIKTNFWSGTNTTWENLKEGVWRLGSANTLSRPSYKSVVCNHVFDTIRNIIRDMYIYVKPMYSIKFHIIL